MMRKICAACRVATARLRCCSLHDADVCWACFHLSANLIRDPWDAGLDDEGDFLECGLDLPTKFDLKIACDDLRRMIAELEAA